MQIEVSNKNGIKLTSWFLIFKANFKGKRNIGIWRQHNLTQGIIMKKQCMKAFDIIVMTETKCGSCVYNKLQRHMLHSKGLNLLVR